MQSVSHMALKGHLGEQAARQMAPEGSERCSRGKPTQIPQQEEASRTNTRSLGYGDFCSTQLAC